MAKKNTTTLSFNYGTWACCIGKNQMTKSVSKMKKIIETDIKRCMVWGYRAHGEHENPLKLSIPFFNPMYVTSEMKAKIEFDDDCVFKCEKLSPILKNRREDAEVSVDGGKIYVTITWIC